MTNMAHQSQLENRKYRNWVKAGLGLKYTKEGLEPFCDQLVKQQHDDILNKVKQKHTLSTVTCGHCDVKTLQPDHVRTKTKYCPLGQINCNCLHSGGKTSCNVCGAIYDEIIKLHASTPPFPYWRNTDAKHWCTEPWSVAKCFINAAGYEKKLKASEFDCSGLLHLLINNMDFRDHLNCTTDGTDLLQEVLQHRNMIYHSHDMELEDEDVTTYIDDMIALLQDGKELINVEHTTSAVEKLKALKGKDFVITTTNETEVREVMADMNRIREEADKQKLELKDTGKEVREQVVRTGNQQITDLEQKGIDIQENVKSDITEKGNQVNKEIVSIGTKVKTEVKEDIRAETTQAKLELEQKQKEMMAQFETKLDVHLEQRVKRDTAIEIGHIQHNLDHDHQKTRFQKTLVDNYMQYALKVSSLPLQPKRNQTEIGNMYASPWMAVEKWDEHSNQTKEIEISLDEIFSNEEELAKYIYILGEAGSGKSALCKYLVYYWCLAHRELTATTIKPEGVKEMEKYDFLFYITLRHFSDFNTIENMLDKIYPDPILRTILQNESDKCLILLDGLDEWTPQNQIPSQFLTPGLPTRDLHAEYTIITTTRRWKFDSLQITDSEIHKTIKLKGITGIAIKDLTKTTVKKLNEIFHKNKVAEDFEPDLQRSPVADLSHVPMILQQLICLWFDDKLGGTSKCSVYSSMLDLFFDWKALKHSGNQFQRSSELEPGQRLPEYLSKYKACYDNAAVIYYLSRLAYKTLFNRNTKDTLTFSNSTFEQMNIPDDVKMCSLNIGVLSEDLNIGLYASTRQQSSFSFVHKSMQEFLAAVHIAIQFEKAINISDVSCKGSDYFEENCKQCVRSHFGDCKSVEDILEQSNVFIMLCGLEPKLLPSITEYIIKIITVDKKTLEERSSLREDYFGHTTVLEESVQNCVIRCIQEAESKGYIRKNSLYIADIVLRRTDVLIQHLHRQIFNVDSVVSLVLLNEREQETGNICSALKLLNKCDSLKTFKYNGMDLSSRETEEQAVEIISRNKSTLECVSLIRVPAQIFRTLVQIMPAMSHLISIQISLTGTMSHEVCTLMCTYLEQSVHLQQIGLTICCGTYDKHLINLSQHKHLKYLDIMLGSIFVTSLNTYGLHTCNVRIRDIVMMNQLCDSLYNTRTLTHLKLMGNSRLPYNSADARRDTDNLIRLLPTLTSLNTIDLKWLIFTDNIITRPLDMKFLKEIKLRDVKMSMTTWCKFVDSLTKLPKNVHVHTFYFKIIDTARSSTYSTEDVASEEEAQQYVRDKTDSFHVTCDYDSLFIFESTQTELRA